MSTIDSPSVTIAISLVLPYLIAILKQPNFSKRTMAWVAIAVSVVAGVAISFLTGNFGVDDVTGTVLFVLGVGQLFYLSIGKQLGLPELTAATNLTDAPTPPVSN